MRAVDLFAGAGGFTQGASQAGVDVVWAANHWQIAVDAHSANHPSAIHVCQDLQQADFTQLPEHELLLASPACQGHSKARGVDRPQHDVTRATAWAVIAAVEAAMPQALIVENVPEFADWQLFPIWRQALEAYGYQVSTQVLDAADAGTPQHRERLFVVGSRQGAIDIEAPQAEHVPASSFIDFESGSWSAIDKPGRAQKTLDRIARGRLEFGTTPFLAPYYGSGSGKTGRSLDRPIGTITTRDRWSLIKGDRMRMLTVAEYAAAMGFPRGYVLETSRKKAIHLLGNAVPPQLAAHVISQVAGQIEQAEQAA
jgi:DNA (cytosine-5)-methyltransferase 1